MSNLSLLEEELLLAFRKAHDALYIGIDHHGDQLTVAVVQGRELADRQRTKPGYSWVPTKVFAQDGLGYVALLDFLAERFPDVPREQYRFLSEPSYAKPSCHFLYRAGFGRHQVLWADTRKVAQFRKTHHLSTSGKNDADDARAMVAMLYFAASHASAPVALFELPEVAPVAASLTGLAEEYHRLSRQGVELKNRICQLVMLLFPELRRVWCRTQKLKVPGRAPYERKELALFEAKTPMRLLQAFPCPADLVAAGFEAVWQVVGGKGVTRAQVLRVLELAGQSGGVRDAREAQRLRLLVEEYEALEARKQAYKAEIGAVLDADPVLASLKRIPWFADHQLATIVGAIGDPKRFKNADAVKRYLNIAPRPMPQTGDIDENGRPIQIWRLPANTYDFSNGRKKLVYRVPGRQDARKVLYLAFETIVMGQNRQPDDPFVQRYLAYKASHAGRSRWLGRVRWKLAAKLVTTIYYCLRHERPYDESQATPALQLVAA